MRATLILLFLCIYGTHSRQSRAELQVGAAAINVNPQVFPVSINGGMTSGSASSSTSPIHARALVLDDGTQRVAMVVVDSCMMSRTFLDEAKMLASKSTGIRPDRIMISATHAHSVPAAMSCLGTDADENYVPFLRLKLVEAIERAVANITPAKVGFAVRKAADYTAVRRWIRRPDRIDVDPFGNKTVRANMHAGRIWDDVTGESGPEDPDLSLISFQAKDGRPLAVLANFSMHYFSGVKAVNADYFGLFSEGLKTRLGSQSTDDKSPSFVGIMSHGCSGDIWRMDYTRSTPEKFNSIKIDEYTQGLLDIAMQAYKEIQYDENADLAMAETRLQLKYRLPDKQRLDWSKAIVEKMGDRMPKTTEEVYAREQLFLHDRQETSVVVQAIRIGSICIATTPTETYALTGIKLKLQSPFEKTMVIELANGGDGYIPPPEQHGLGGYNTWAARSAGLEVEAEPKIAEAGVELLEQVCGKPRRQLRQSLGTAAQKIIASKPAAYWRMDETVGPRAEDISGANLDGIYEPGVVFFLEGARSNEFCSQGQVNRSAHFAGGRMRARVPMLGDHYAVTMCFWNGMPLEARPVAGWMFGRGRNHAVQQQGDALGIVGQGENAGKILFQSAGNKFIGKNPVPRWTWAEIRFVRKGNLVTVFLNGNEEAEIQVDAPFDLPLDVEDLYFGGRGNRDSSWEGRLDEIAVYRLLK